MSYSLHIADTRKYIIVIIKGPITIDLARQYSMEAREMGRSTGIQRFLFDVRDATNRSSTFENYEFAYRNAQEMQLERKVHSAILADPNDSSHDFVELTMRNAGFCVKLFRDEDTAINWLEE